MAKTEKDKTKRKIISYLKKNKKSIKTKFFIAMVVMLAIIAIILVDIVYQNGIKLKNEKELKIYDVQSMSFNPCEDYNTYKFISDYFKARTNLNFVKIFSCFNRDYNFEKKKDKKGYLKDIENNIKYERTFVRGYENIKVYSDEGLLPNETICIVTYDMVLGFTDDKAPMIIIFYLVNDGENIYIKNDLDVGTSKFILDCMNNEAVKSLFNDIEKRLTRLLVSNESLKLAYNSLRQFEMNFAIFASPLKREINKSFDYVEYDLIKDADRIYSDIKKKKEEQKRVDDYISYMNRVVASLSDIQRIPLSKG